MSKPQQKDRHDVSRLAVLLTLLVAGAAFVVGLLGMLGVFESPARSGSGALEGSAFESTVNDTGRPKARLEQPGARTRTNAAVTDDDRSAAELEDLITDLGEAGQGSWRLSGTVLDARTGERVPGPLEVGLFDRNGSVFGSTNDRGGSYWVVTQTAGLHVLEVSAKGYLPLERNVTFAEPRGPEHLNLVLEPVRRVLVRVQTPEGEPLEGLIGQRGLGDPDKLVVIATAAVPVAKSLGVAPPRRGRYGIGMFDGTHAALAEILDGDPVGRDMLGVLELDPRSPVIASLVYHDTVLETQSVETQQNELLFVVGLEAFQRELASVRVRVVDAESRAPVAGRASVSPFAFLFLGKPLDEDGAREFVDLVPGRHWLVVEVEGRETKMLPLSLRAGETRDLGTIEVEPPRSVTGRVTDRHGQPVVGDVTLVRQLSDERGGVVHAKWHTYSGKDGIFGFDGLGPDRYALFLAADESSSSSGRVLPWASPVVWVDLSAESQGDVVVPAEPGADLRIEREGFAASPVEFEVRTSDGLAIRSGSVERWQPVELTLARGAYTVAVLERGVVTELSGVEVGSGSARVVVRR